MREYEKYTKEKLMLKGFLKLSYVGQELVAQDHFASDEKIEDQLFYFSPEIKTWLDKMK